jgi:hypothetical protein
LDDGEVVGGKFVVAYSDPTTLLDPSEEPFDPVAGALEIRAETDRVSANAFGRANPSKVTRSRHRAPATARAACEKVDTGYSLTRICGSQKTLRKQRNLEPIAIRPNRNRL